MTDEQICQFLARKPGSRALDIADHLDVELREVSEALRGLVDNGDVTRYAGTAPNGLQSQLYVLSEAFKETRQGAALIASVLHVLPVPVLEAPAIPLSQVAPIQDPPKPPASSPAPTVLQPPCFADQTVLAKITKVQLAINLLKAKGAANDDDMRTAMGLSRTSSPKNFLSSAITSGKVCRIDGVWRLGDGKAKVEVPVQFQMHEPVQTGADEAKHLADLPEQHNGPVEDDLNVRAPLQGVSRDSAAFRCGLWSDGVIELQRNGATVLRLSQDEAQQMVRFVGTFCERNLAQAPIVV
jgi:hypothetical protein